MPFTVEVCTGVQELADGAVILGPNPFTDALTLRPTSDVRYVLYNAVGAELLSGTARGGALIRSHHRMIFGSEPLGFRGQPRRETRA